MCELKALISVETKNSSCYTYNKFLEKETSVRLLQRCLELDLEHHPPIKIMSLECRMRRDVGFYSDEGKGYRFSGQISKSKPLEKWMINMMNNINTQLGTDFNGLLINRYIGGLDYIGAHSDNEIGISNNKVVAVTLATNGCKRIFRIRDKTNKKIIVDVITKNRQLLVMDGMFQKEFTHEIVASKKISNKDVRISVTFRTHKI